MPDVLSRLTEIHNGRTTRKSYAKIGDVIDMPNLI